MSIGYKLLEFQKTIENGYDQKLFDELYHDDYQGFSNSQQQVVTKDDIRQLMEACHGVKNHGCQVLYENADVLVIEFKVTFPANSARAEGSYTIVEFNDLKDGKIVSHRSGMTKTS